jgi:hypothetical protein
LEQPQTKTTRHFVLVQPDACRLEAIMADSQLLTIMELSALSDAEFSKYVKDQRKLGGGLEVRPDDDWNKSSDKDRDRFAKRILYAAPFPILQYSP